MKTAALWVGSGVLGLAALAAHAQAPQTPVFRSGTTSVVVDLRVTDRDGAFVADLGLGDFQIFEDDKPQQIDTFSLVRIPIETTEPVPVPRVSPDVATNAHANDGRLYVMLLDDLEAETDTAGQYQALRSPNVRALARDFVEHHVTDIDRVALLTTSGRSDMRVQFTNDRRRLLTSIDKFVGGYGQVHYTQGSNRDNLHLVVLTLKSLSQWLESISGRRKAIVLFGERLGRTMRGGLSAIADLEGREIQEFVHDAARANVSLYAMDSVGVPTGRSGTITPVTAMDDSASFDLDRISSLVSVAEATGGFAAVFSNDYTTAFKRVVDESSSYYLLGYTPTNTRRDGTFRKIRVEVRRPGVSVRARSGYVPAKSPSGRASGGNALPPNLASLVNSPIDVAGLELSVNGAAFRKGSSGTLELVIEAKPDSVKHADASFNGVVDVAVVAADRDGNVKATQRGTLNLRLSSPTREVVAERSVRMVQSLALRPGDYHVSVAASDNGSGQSRGSVWYDVTVPDFSRALSMSGLAMGSVDNAAVPTAGSLARWTGTLRMPPTTARVFARSDELRVFAEVYDNDRRPHQTDVRTTIRSAAGVEPFETKETILPSKGEAYPVFVSVPLSDVGPGDYVLTVTAVSSVNRGEPVVRELPFAVR